MTVRLLLDVHYSEQIAASLRTAGHDVVAIVADPVLRGQSDDEVFRQAAVDGRRIVTECIKDFRPLLLTAYATDEAVAALLLVPPGRFPRGAGRRTTTIVRALIEWLSSPQADNRPDEDWLVEGVRQP